MNILQISVAHIIEKLLPASLQARMAPFFDRLQNILTGADETSKAQRDSFYAFMIRIISAAIAFLSQVVLARLMGPFEYGVFVLVWVAMIIIGNLSCFGFQTAIIRFLPQYSHQNDFLRVRGILFSSRMFVLLSASGAAVLTWLVLYFGSDWFQSYYILPFIVGTFALPMVALGDVLDGTARANGWPVKALTPTYLVRPIFLLIFMMIAWALGYPINGVTGLVCAVAATYVTTITQLAFLSSALDARFGPGKTKIEFGHWFLVAIPIFLVEGFFFLQVNADVLMVGFMMEPDDVGIYYATVKTMAVVHFVFFAVKAGVSNLFASHMHDKDRSALRALARQSATWTFWPSLLMGALVLLAGPLLLSMFGAAFVDGYNLLFILVAGVVIRASIGPAENLLNMSGNQNICAVVFGCILATNLMLNLILIPIYGLYGAALSTAIATLVETISLYFLVRSRVGISMFAFAKPVTKDI